MSSPNLRTVAKCIDRLFVGMSLVAFDFTVGRGEGTQRYLPDGSEGTVYRGYRFDLIPDELGYVLIGLALLRLAETVTPRIGLGLRALAAWQLVLIALEFRSHFVFPDPSNLQVGVAATGLAGSAATVLGAWLIARSCGELGLSASERCWGRVALVEACLFVLLAGGSAYFLLSGDPLYREADSAWSMGLGGIVLALSVVSAGLFVYACFATRSEAQGGARPDGAAVPEPEPLL